MNDDVIVIGVLCFLLVILIVFGPFVLIWAFNTLFPMLNIPFTFWTWLAVNILMFFGKANIRRS